MEERHSIDKLFRDKLNHPEIPFDERDWIALSRKMHGRKRRLPIIWFGSGIAAAAVIVAALLLVGRRDPVDPPLSNKPISASATIPRRDTTRQANASPAMTATTATTSSMMLANTTDSRIEVPSLASIPVYKPTPATVTARREGVIHRMFAPIPKITPETVPSATDRHEPTLAKSVDGRWTLSIAAAPDLSGTQPLSGQLSGNIGLIGTYRLNRRLSLSAGVLYAKKRYRTDFAQYRPSGGWSDPQLLSTLVYADCNVLDIPLNLNFDIAHRHRSTWFASIGASSYLMLSETYDYTYPPHEYGYPKKITIHNQNRHILGIGNVSVGYRQQVNPTFSISVQPFVKVPLTGIGNGNLKLYSTGVAVSADIDFSQRKKP